MIYEKHNIVTALGSNISRKRKNGEIKLLFLSASKLTFLDQPTKVTMDETNNCFWWLIETSFSHD